MALFLGGLDIHQFYVGNMAQGWIRLLFCWTFIPAILALFDAFGFRRHTRNANVAIARKVAFSMNVPEDTVVKIALI